MQISAAEKKIICRRARRAIMNRWEVENFSDLDMDSVLLEWKRPVFVTLLKWGELRGCMGTLSDQEPLEISIPRLALESAFRDPRFSPVSRDEMKDVSIEVSILMDFELIKALDEIEIGRHGLLMKKGLRSGVFLPQVAVEEHWNREEFLSHLSLKAGLESRAWEKGADIYRFETIRSCENRCED